MKNNEKIIKDPLFPIKFFEAGIFMTTIFAFDLVPQVLNFNEGILNFVIVAIFLFFIIIPLLFLFSYFVLWGLIMFIKIILSVLPMVLMAIPGASAVASGARGIGDMVIGFATEVHDTIWGVILTDNLKAKIGKIWVEYKYLPFSKKYLYFMGMCFACVGIALLIRLGLSFFGIEINF